jgi:hypothetical protein
VRTTAAGPCGYIFTDERATELSKEILEEEQSAREQREGERFESQ